MDGGAIIAPSELLAPNTTYQVAVNTAPRSTIDGNQLRPVTRRSVFHDWFLLACFQGLGWLLPTNSSDGTPGGLWDRQR